MVRIIETKSQPVSLAIAESTNSQTPIKSRDLRSNDDIQKKLEEAFEGMGLFYERKLKQHNDKPKNLRIDALSSGQAHLAYSLELPEVAKKDRGRVFADLYDQVFTEELIADDLLNAVKILNLIEAEKRKVQAAIKKQEDFDRRFIFLIDGAYHALFAVGQLCDARAVDRFDFENAKKLVPNAMEYIAQIVASAQEADESFSFNRYFKDARTKTRVASYIQAEESKDL